MQKGAKKNLATIIKIKPKYKSKKAENLKYKIL